MYFVSFTFVHHATVIFSLHVNVNVNVPLVHAASVIVHVGFTVSIHFHVTVILFVVSPSVMLILHVSSHVLFASGAYVILSPFTLHVHFVHLLFVSTVALIVSQLHAAAALKSFQLTVLDVFHTLVCPVKSCPVITTSAHVYVTVFVVTFHAVSFTFTVTL